MESLEEASMSDNKGKSKELQGEVSPKDVFIVVMGPTGSGKTTFVNKCSGSSLEVGHSLESETHSVTEVTFEHKGVRIHLLDTPGFDDTTRSDTDVLKDIAVYLAATYTARIEMDGIIYITRITDRRMSGTSRRNLRMFSSLVGDKALTRVMLATSMWDEIDAGVAEARETQLCESFWKEFIDEGSKVGRLDGTRNGAMRVLDTLISDQGDREVLQIQNELVNESKPLSQTAAGLELTKDISEQQQKFETQLNFVRAELEVALEAKDADLVQALREELARLEYRLSQAENEKERLHIDLQRLLRESEEKNALLTRQIESERAKQAVHIEQIVAELNDLRKNQQENIGGLTGPPPPYSKSTLSEEMPEVVEDRKTHTKLSPDTSGDETEKSDDLRSYLARNQNKSPQQVLRKKPARGTRPSGSRRDRVNLRVLDEEREKVRKEIYQNSLLGLGLMPSKPITEGEILKSERIAMREANFLEQVDKSSISNEAALREALRKEYSNPESVRGALFAGIYVVRNEVLAVYANCKRLQNAKLAGSWFSMLVLATSSGATNSIVNLNRVIIDEIRELLKVLNLLASFMQKVVTRPLPRGLLDSSEFTALAESCSEVQAQYQHIFGNLGLSDHSPWASEDKMRIMLDNLFVKIDGHSPNFLHHVLLYWRCITRALDHGVIAYESGHVSSFDAQRYTMDIGPIPFRGYLLFRSLRLKCLAGFFEYRDVWVLALDSPKEASYLEADIETFADVWGPVWKVENQPGSGLIAKYNVRGGSIIPWPFNPDIHPELKANERLCHWESNADYVHLPSEEAANSDSSLSSSDTEDVEDSLVELGYFRGNERLVIGVEQDPALRWYHCHCSLHRLKQHLESAGRLDHLIASKSYRYIDSRQKTLVAGSHGVQAGIGRTIKDKSEEPLKVNLLDQWENEAQSRDPRDFENIWGVAVSLCTMNARRVRLVELLGEASVVALLRHFRWSDLSADGSRSHRRRRYLRAVRSPDPSALGDLWEDHPDWRQDLGDAVLICLRILFRTGYNVHRDEFHILWLPPGCRAPRRVTLKPTDQSWFRFLRDTTYSVTVAVIIEESLGTGPCNSHITPRWFKHPSILETAICVNHAVDPANKLIASRGHRDESRSVPPGSSENWETIWDVSHIDPGEKFLMRSQNRVGTICSLTRWHLLLEVETVKRQVLREMIGMRPAEQKGHWEYTDEELDGDDTRPIPVHITS